MCIVKDKGPCPEVSSRSHCGQRQILPNAAAGLTLDLLLLGGAAGGGKVLVAPLL